MNQQSLVTVAPVLSDPHTLVIYRDNGQEIIVKVNTESKTLASAHKINIEEVKFIRENYL